MLAYNGLLSIAFIKNQNKSNFLFAVAGAGLAPAPGGYEPPDLLLVHPAMKGNIPVCRQAGLPFIILRKMLK